MAAAEESGASQTTPASAGARGANGPGWAAARTRAKGPASGAAAESAGMAEAAESGRAGWARAETASSSASGRRRSTAGRIPRLVPARGASDS